MVRGRNSDTTSLGDWIEDQEKFPEGLQKLAEKVREKGVEFGIWFEPEMVSPESELYKKHPDWVIRSKRYHRFEVGISLFWILQIQKCVNI